MDLPATFQSSFQQMIIKVKQDVVIDIHRRIDHQASAIYQLFLAEYQRKSSSSSGTALDQGSRTLTPTPAPVMTGAVGNVLRKGQRPKMATRSSTQQQQQQQQQSSSSSSNTAHQASTSTASTTSTARPFHHLSGSGDQNSNSSTEGSANRTTTTKTSSTHKDPNWIADFEENDCSCEDCKVGAEEEEDDHDEGEGEGDEVGRHQTGHHHHHHSRLLEDGSTALQPIVSMDTSSDGHSHSQDQQQQQQQGMQYQEQGHYPQHHPQQQHLQQNIDHQQPQPHQQHSHHPHHPHHPHHQQQSTFIPTAVSTSPVAQPIRSSANYKAQHGGGGGCNNGATVGGGGGGNNSNSSSTSNSAGTMVCPEPGCGKYFDQMSRYKRHINYHYKIKPYRCRYPGCSYASTESCNVVSHVRIRHFRLPKSKEKQRELEIVDDRDPKQYVETVRELL